MCLAGSGPTRERESHMLQVRAVRHTPTYVLFCLAVLAAPLGAVPPEEIDLGQIVTGQPPGVRQTERRKRHRPDRAWLLE